MADVPHEFRCPISMEMMRDPVVCEDGHSYDRENIVDWLKRSATSPMTRQPISLSNIRPNHALKASISRWEQEKNKPKPKPSAPPPQPSAPRVVVTPNQYQGYQPPPFTQGQVVPPFTQAATQNAYVTHSIVPYSTPKVREPTPQQITQAEQQKKTIKIVLTLCSSIIFLIIIISILSIKTRSHSENDDD